MAEPKEFKLGASTESLAQMEMCKDAALKLGQSFVSLTLAYNKAGEDLNALANLLKNIDIQMKVKE